MIPKNIFQTWKTYDVPSKWVAAQQSVISKNPTWQYTLLSDGDAIKIIQENFPEFLPYFLGFKYDIQRADAIRYVVMYLYGGIYLDLDYTAIKSFDGITLPHGKDVGLLVSNNTKRYVTNSFLVSKPKTKFWLDCLNAMKEPKSWWAITKHLEVFDTTGPFMVNRVFDANQPIAEKLELVSVPCDVCQLDVCHPDQDYFIMPIKGDSWHSWDSTMINWVYCDAALPILTIVLVIIILLSRSFYRRRFR